MMNIVLSGENGEAEAHFKVPGHRRVGERDLMLYSLEIAGSGGYWVEFSRALIAGEPSKRTLQMAEVYPEAMEAARKLMRDGVLSCDVCWCCSPPTPLHAAALRWAICRDIPSAPP